MDPEDRAGKHRRYVGIYHITRRENLRLGSMLHITIPILRSDMTTNECEHVLEVYENSVLWVKFGNTRHITTPCMICTCHQYCEDGYKKKKYSGNVVSMGLEKN